VPTEEDAARVALAFPQVTEDARHGNRAWLVAGKALAWIRPSSKADLRRFGDERPPEGPILAVRVENLVEKDAILGEHRRGVFTIPHFNGYPAVLIQLRTVGPKRLREAPHGRMARVRTAGSQPGGISRLPASASVRR
jgi:hypothetical protein